WSDGAVRSWSCRTSLVVQPRDCSRRLLVMSTIEASAVDARPASAIALERQLGTVIVTGGASGLGAAAADAIAGAGGTPIIRDRAVSDATAYCASKFGVVGFTRSLTAELKGRVGVTMLTPGGMHTAFFEDRDEKYKPAADAALCRPEDVAAGVVFALSRPVGCE